jgi:hypothetical protein
MAGEENVTAAFQYMQGYDILYLINSPWFIIMLVLMIVFIPLGLYGMVALWKRIDVWMKVRNGYIRCRKKQTNGTWKNFWARPIGRKITVKGEEGWDYELPIFVGKDVMALEKDINRMPSGDVVDG